MRVVSAIALIGTVSLAIFYILAVRWYYGVHQPTKVGKPPKFLYAIEGQRQPLNGPIGITVAFGRVFVSDSGNSNIVEFTREGLELFKFPARQFEDSYYRPYPQGVAVDRFGRIYTAVFPDNRLMVFDWDGNYRYTFPQRLSPIDSGIRREINKPIGLGYSDDRLYLTDVGDHELKIFTTTGKLIRKIGGPGSSEGRFTFPNGMAIGDDGRIYVADSNNARVQVFSPEGKFLSVLDAPAGTMSLPRGVAIDKLGRVHVVDMLNNKVLTFDQSGNFLLSYGQPADDTKALALPSGIFIDRDTGLIFIADRGNNRVAVWAEK